MVELNTLIGERPFLIKRLYGYAYIYSAEPVFNCHMQYGLSRSHLRRFDVMLFEGAVNQSVVALGGIR